MEILRCEDIKKVFGKDAGQVTALNGISLSVEKGDFVAIVGASRRVLFRSAHFRQCG